MAQRTDVFDLGRLGLAAGEGRRIDVRVGLDDVALGGQRYPVRSGGADARLDASRMRGGWSLRLRYRVELDGPCMRCLEASENGFAIDSREVDQPGGGAELTSPYVEGAELDLRGWARDALVLALPTQLLCRDDCRGLCAICGANLNEDPGHRHESAPDPRWAKLSELKLD
jgi:uncharacterized protein